MHSPSSDLVYPGMHLSQNFPVHSLQIGSEHFMHLSVVVVAL